MTGRVKPSEGSLLKRWSRLKNEAREMEKERGSASRSGPPPATPNPDSANAVTTSGTRAPAAPTSAGTSAAPADALPPVESLTIDSDFAAFLKPKVDQALKRRALRQLFRDPHFNVMDGLDVYIDDYSKPDPISPEIVRELVQARYIFDPPPTRINAQGHVEDVPPEELAAIGRDENAAPDQVSQSPEATPAAPLPAPESEETEPAQLSLPELDAPAASQPR
jgi:hypothetical protein